MLIKLREILVKLYLNESDVRRIVYDIGIDMGRITFSGSSINMWQSVLEEAVKSDRVGQLLTRAITEYPDNRELQAAYHVYLQQTDGDEVISEKPHAQSPTIVSTKQPARNSKRRLYLAPTITLLFVLATGLVWYQGCLPAGDLARPSATPQPEPTDTPSEQADFMVTSPTSIPATATSTPLPSPTPTVPATETAVPPVTVTSLSEPPTAVLYVVDDINDSSDSSYLLEGGAVEQINVGADLVVYGEPNPGIELVIALVRVTGKSSNALTAQVLLQHPDYEIRNKMRVDDNLDYLSESQLIPVFDYVDGYLLRPTRIRLRPGHGLAVGAQLQALAYERIGEEIVDALPMAPPVQMEVTSLGMDGQIAGVALVAGEWPVTGTVVSLVEASEVASLPTATATTVSMPSPTETPTPIPGPPCKVNIQSPQGTWPVLISFRSVPAGTVANTLSFDEEVTVIIRDVSADTRWYRVEVNGRVQGWADPQYFSRCIQKSE